jgi:dihydrofolate reductase
MSSIIVAQANHRVIGRYNELPWYLPADLKHFREITENNTVVMGRLTMESIANRLNGPLPNRRNIVISSTLKQGEVSGFEICNSLDELRYLTDISSEMVFIIGGGRLYEAALDQNIVSKIYLTQINQDIKGDTFFPILDTNTWHEVSREHHKKDSKTPYDYDFIEFTRSA